MDVHELKVGDRLQIMFKPACFRPFQVVAVYDFGSVDLQRADNVPAAEIGTPAAMVKYGYRRLTVARLGQLFDLGCVRDADGTEPRKRLVWE